MYSCISVISLTVIHPHTCRWHDYEVIIIHHLEGFHPVNRNCPTTHSFKQDRVNNHQSITHFIIQLNSSAAAKHNPICMCFHMIRIIEQWGIVSIARCCAKHCVRCFFYTRPLFISMPFSSETDGEGNKRWVLIDNRHVTQTVMSPLCEFSRCQTSTLDCYCDPPFSQNLSIIENQYSIFNNK